MIRRTTIVHELPPRSTMEPMDHVSIPRAMVRLYDWEVEDSVQPTDIEATKPRPEDRKVDQDLGDKALLTAVEIIDAKLGEHMTVANKFQHLEPDFTRQQN